MKKLLYLPILLLTGCLTLSPLVNEEKTVTPVNTSTVSVSVPNGMVFYDTRPATRGIRFPEGTYILEAEDSEYFYYKSPTPLDLRVFEKGQLVDLKNLNGGLMLLKSSFSMVPGSGYISDLDPYKKVQIWKLGREFINLEGKEWKKN